MVVKQGRYSDRRQTYHSTVYDFRGTISDPRDQGASQFRQLPNQGLVEYLGFESIFESSIVLNIS
jgi:hypothetical protein